MARPEIDLDISTQDFISDPNPFYERVRDLGDVVWNTHLNAWMVVGYDAAREVLTDDGQNYVMYYGEPEVSCWFEGPNIIIVDGEYHRRLRSILYPYFTRAAIEEMRPKVEQTVERLLAPLIQGAQSCDLIEEFTMLPTVIIASMLGVPDDRHDDVRRWSHDIDSNIAAGRESTEKRAIIEVASREVNDFFSAELERHRRERPDDLLTMMLSLPNDLKMTEAEIRSTAVLLLLAGYDTTAKTMSNCLISLEAHPEQRRAVVEDPSLLPDAIEESMRWHTMVQWISRRAVKDTTLAGVTISATEDVFVFLAAANRDPRRWDNPERFDIYRPRKTHVAFGYGPHLCIGAALARLEVEVAIGRLLQLAPEYQLRDIDFGTSFFVRGPEKGTIAVTAQPPTLVTV